MVAVVDHRRGPKIPTLLARLGEKFVFAPDGCWLWTAGLSSGGYGRIYTGQRHEPAHRVMYELLIGPIPEGLEPDHLCRVRRCVNPSHLEPVTRAENIARGNSPLGRAGVARRRRLSRQRKKGTGPET